MRARSLQFSTLSLNVWDAVPPQETEAALDLHIHKSNQGASAPPGIVGREGSPFGGDPIPPGKVGAPGGNFGIPPPAPGEGVGHGNMQQYNTPYVGEVQKVPSGATCAVRQNELSAPIAPPPPGDF